MGMRGPGQIAELAQVAEPDVAVIVSVGPVHLEVLGSVEAVAAAKAELIAALPPGGTAVLPAGEPLLDPHRRGDVRTLTFGGGAGDGAGGGGAGGGDVRLMSADGERLSIAVPGQDAIELEFPFTQAHLRTNLLAAVAAAIAVGVRPAGRVEPALSAGRGQRIALPGGTTLIDDCYNANPMSMRAALDDLVATAAAHGDAHRDARAVAVLGDMLELGPRARDFHVEIGHHANAVGVDLLVTVGPLAAAIGDGYAGEVYTVADAAEAAAFVAELIEPGDVVLVKASRGVGLETVCEKLAVTA
jgi:UDP-N-acetylmuramoyl-tripeptide--D-alanyl-D-alanine ligase